MARPPSSSPVAEALNWVSRITTVGLMMVLPAVGGRWLDNRNDTSHWGPIGLVLGLAVGMYQIVLIAGAAGRASPRKPSGKQSDDGKPEARR